MASIRRSVCVVLALVLCSGIGALTSPTFASPSGSVQSEEYLPPGGGPASDWKYKTFVTTYEGGSESCRMWLRKPDHEPAQTGPVVAHAALTCPYLTSNIAGTFVLQAEGDSGKSTSGPVWMGPCEGHGYACWHHRSSPPYWVYAMTLSTDRLEGKQLAYDSFSLYDPFNQCPGAGCLLLTWRTQI